MRASILETASCLPGVVLTIFGEPEKAGMLPHTGVASCCTTVEGLWKCLVSLGPGKVLAEQRIRLSLGGKKMSLGAGD